MSLVSFNGIVQGKQTTLVGGSGSALNDPINNPQAWDTVTIGGLTSPGVVVAIEGFNRSNGWQIKRGKGSIGGTLTYTNKPPTEGAITFALWTTTHFQEWDVFRDLFIYNPAATPDQQAVEIHHPALDDLNVNSVVCKEISPVRHAGKGKYLVKVSLIEYLPTPKKSVVQSVTFTNQGGGVQIPAGYKPTATQKAKDAISGLLAQLQSNP